MDWNRIRDTDDDTELEIIGRESQSGSFPVIHHGGEYDGMVGGYGRMKDRKLQPSRVLLSPDGELTVVGGMR